MKTIKQLRKISNMSQKRFSEYLHIPLKDIQNWEQELRTPPSYIPELIERIMRNDDFLVDNRNNFYVFRSNIQHRIKENKRKALLDIIKNNEIEFYYSEKEYLKCLYLLSCVDTLCLELNYPLCTEYERFRELKCKKPVFISTLNKHRDKNISYLPEFEKHNIFEVSIYDIC